MQCSEICDLHMDTLCAVSCPVVYNSFCFGFSLQLLAKNSHFPQRVLQEMTYDKMLSDVCIFLYLLLDFDSFGVFFSPS